MPPSIPCLPEHHFCSTSRPSLTSIDRLSVDSLARYGVLQEAVQTPFSTSNGKANELVMHHRRSLPSVDTSPAYPQVKRVDTTFTYNSTAHGQVTVADPYNWLEQNVSTPDVKAFYEVQDALTQQYIDKCNDRQGIAHILESVISYAHFTVPQCIGPKENRMYYYWQNSGQDAFSTLYAATRDELLEAEKSNYATLAGKPFFNQTLLSKDGSKSIFDLWFSFSGKIAAYAVTDAGTDYHTLYFRETSKPFVERPSDDSLAAQGGPDRLPDVIKLRLGGVQWLADDQGVFYNSFTDEVANNDTLYFHRLGTTQEQDVLIMGQAGSNWGFTTTSDGKWLELSDYNGDAFAASVYLAPLDQPISSEMKWISVTPTSDFALLYVGNVGNTFYFHTNKDAPNWKLVRTTVDPSKAAKVNHVHELTDEATFEDVIAEDKELMLDDVYSVNGDKLLLVYIKDVKHELRQYVLSKGQFVHRLLPEIFGTIDLFDSREDVNEVYLRERSLTTPGIVYRLTWEDETPDPSALPTSAEHHSTTLRHVDLSALQTQQVFVTSHDGVKVPMYIVHHKDAKMDGTAPAIVYFYGAHGVSLMPLFSSPLISWITAYGGILVWVSARGGLEYGEAWYKGGSLTHKKNTFFDILSACQYLVDQNFAAKGKIVIHGRSAGGLAALAVANMAPEGLLGAMIAGAPVADLLRYELFTTGALWTTEYGDPKNPDLFDYMLTWSPLHNVNASKEYPYMLITTADNDDRVVPMHSFKMIAQLQHALPRNPHPMLLRVLQSGGHGLHNTLNDTVVQYADDFCLVSSALGLDVTPLSE